MLRLGRAAIQKASVAAWLQHSAAPPWGWVPATHRYVRCQVRQLLRQHTTAAGRRSYSTADFGDQFIHTDTPLLPIDLPVFEPDKFPSESGLQQQGGAAAAKPHKEIEPPNPGVGVDATHFMALRVSHSPKVVASISTIQQQLIKADHCLAPCCLDPITAHITIMVLRLPTQVLYLDVAPGPARDALMALGSTVIDHFTAAAGSRVLIHEDTKPFIPHITIAKTSRLLGRRGRGILHPERVKIPNSVLQEYAKLDIGHVSINEIQICGLHARQRGQYYRITHRLRLGEPLPNVPTAPAAGHKMKRRK